MSLARRQIPSRLSFNTPSTPNFRDSRCNTPEREVIRALSPTTERELRRSCSAVVLALASPRISTIPERALPTPAFPKKQTFQGRRQSQAQTQPPIPQTQPWSQFDFKLSVEGSTSSHSLSSIIDSTFSRMSSEMGTSSWSPTTTHQSKSSDGDQFFHAQTADLTVLPPMPQKPMPGSPPARYAFAKTATARKMSLNYNQINPRASSIVTVAAEQRGETPPVLVRPTMINVPRPRTSSGIPGSPRFRNSSVPPSLDGSTKSRSDSQANVSVSGLGLGLNLEVQTAKANAVGSSPLATPITLDSASGHSPVIVRIPNSASPSSASPRRESHHIRSVTSTPLLSNPRTSTSNPPKGLTRRRTDMDPPTNPRKFSLFPCQDVTPVIIKDTQPVLYSPPARSVTSRQMSISSIGRPRTSGGAEIPKLSTDSWNRPLPPLPAVSDATGNPGKGKKGGKEKGEKTTFKSLRKQVLSSFQNFSGSLKLKSSISSRDKSGSRKDAGTHDGMPHVGIGVAA
ncbi:hypothetical protein L211DRAFT_136508 [Terfezia boudieri ATCC MYA-4762]|uniref:Uncharacterized protein n=1 Tax=Terfezia boudieri ATCC MYA-4762 TaxID=1051890 RepID=A0A3N4LQF8_9PEZI|nr:hypothetical protein L211DRAFT_136508 [Terfezia boudieri ATCC MYA-4762]